ncbi:hypothetical protein VPH35_103160 [Triticum aestivum]
MSDGGDSVSSDDCIDDCLEACCCDCFWDPICFRILCALVILAVLATVVTLLVIAFVPRPVGVSVEDAALTRLDLAVKNATSTALSYDVSIAVAVHNGNLFMPAEHTAGDRRGRGPTAAQESVPRHGGGRQRERRAGERRRGRLPQGERCRAVPARGEDCRRGHVPATPQEAQAGRDLPARVGSVNGNLAGDVQEGQVRCSERALMLRIEATHGGSSSLLHG